MAFNNLLWVGLICCLSALVIQIFPSAAFNVGVDVSASWMLFVFGVFLIVVAAIAQRTSGSPRR